MLLLNIILNSLLKWFAPILSFTTEEIYQLVSKNKKSIHLEKFLDFPKKFQNFEIYKKWTQLLRIRDICNLSIEEKRANKEIGSSLEAALKIRLNEEDLKIVQGIDLAELCITSSVEIDNNVSKETTVQTVKLEGKKCPICWKIFPDKCSRHS